MIMYVMSILTHTQIQPILMYIIMVLEISYVLIRFLLIVIPKEHKAHKILLRVFKGLKQVENDINDHISEKKEDDDE